MRVISGIYKHRRFDVPRSFKARPTTDFAKENIFNVLNNRMDFDGAVALDLFAGTGSISLELVSRGCEKVPDWKRCRTSSFRETFCEKEAYLYLNMASRTTSPPILILSTIARMGA